MDRCECGDKQSDHMTRGHDEYGACLRCDCQQYEKAKASGEAQPERV